MNQERKIILPKLIGEGMVLQRGTGTRIWGWAPVGIEVKVVLQGMNRKALTKETGEWEVVFEHLETGGPYELTILADKEKIVLHEVYVGDVWLCSGQSNMELPMERVKDKFPEDIMQCTNPFIRVFKIKEHYDFDAPLVNHVEASWQGCSRETILAFSAVSYFFAKYIEAKVKVPVGIINASLGGSPIESWLPEEEIQEFPNFRKLLIECRDVALVEQILIQNAENEQQWIDVLNAKDQGLREPEWYKSEVIGENGRNIKIPSFFKEVGLGELIGVIWLKRTFNVPKEMAGHSASLWLGTIVDRDETYVNGYLVGSTSYQYPPRKYEVPEGVLHEGENSITVRVICNAGNGRVTPDKEYKIFSNRGTIHLAGQWQYLIGCHTEQVPPTDFISWKPTGLYNGMLAPCHLYTIKGVLWYQGESNAGKPEPYDKLLEKLILSWRRKWRQGDIPFLIAQLPNFEIDLPEKESGWPQLRAAQLSVEKLSAVGTTINIDLGEANDIHPLDKKQVAYRFSLAARALAYQEEVVWKGPRVQKIRKQMQQVKVDFTEVGGGLMTKGNGKVTAFELAGADGIFYPALAEIYPNYVLLISKAVTNPKSVRYAYDNNPKGQLLYNTYGLPMAPFEKIITSQSSRKYLNNKVR